MKNIAKKDYQMATLNELFGEYTVSTIDEYFELLDKEQAKRTRMIAKSLTKYLKNVKANENNETKLAAIH